MKVTCPTTSPFDTRIPILVIDPRDRPSRFDSSHAFALFGQGVEVPLIVVDARILQAEWMTEDHLLVILAHETGHIQKQSTEEREADERGLQLVKNAGYEAAYRIYQAEYESRYQNVA